MPYVHPRWPAAAQARGPRSAAAAHSCGALLALALALGSPVLRAEDTPAAPDAPRAAAAWMQPWQAAGGYWRVAVSPYTHHWTFSEQHREVYALALERQRSDGWLAGASRFRNSFGQPSAYLYLGWRSGPLLELEPLFWQWSAGLMYGYRGEFKDKVPLNFGGFSPGALLSLGWQTSRRSSVMVHALGEAGVMLQLSWDLR
jgi:hypothetical protein